MYPNPTKDVIHLSSKENMIAATITDLSGKTVYETGLRGVDGQVNLSNLAQGMYLLRVASNQDVRTMQIIKE